MNKAVKLVSDSAVDQITCTKSKVPTVVDAAEIDTASDLDLDHAPDSGSKPRCEVWRLERAPKLLHQYALGRVVHHVAGGHERLDPLFFFDTSSGSDLNAS